jgi:hypothetical protein
MARLKSKDRVEDRLYSFLVGFAGYIYIYMRREQGGAGVCCIMS